MSSKVRALQWFLSNVWIREPIHRGNDSLNKMDLGNQTPAACFDSWTTERCCAAHSLDRLWFSKARIHRHVSKYDQRGTSPNISRTWLARKPLAWGVPLLWHILTSSPYVSSVSRIHLPCSQFCAKTTHFLLAAKGVLRSNVPKVWNWA